MKMRVLYLGLLFVVSCSHGERKSSRDSVPSAHDVLAVIRTKKLLFSECYSKSFLALTERQKKNHHGKIVIYWEFNSKGIVEKTEIMKSTIPEGRAADDLGHCLLGVIKKSNFAEHLSQNLPKGNISGVTFPFVFRHNNFKELR